MIDTVSVKDEFQRKGVYEKMLFFLLNKFKLPIVSSPNRTKDANNFWMKMKLKSKNIFQEGSYFVLLPYKPDIKYADGGLIAPNGKKSNLTPEQYKLVRTPEFKAWFGDWENYPESASKIVDENGEPKVMYHFSDFDFNVFELKGASKGFFFTENEKDDEFSSEGVLELLDKGIKPRWAIKYGLTIEQLRQGIKEESKYKKAKLYFLNIKKIDKEIMPDEKWSVPRFENSRIMQSKWSFEKYDGIEFINEVDKKSITVAYYPEQIKLADGTNTTFDSSNPDIRYGKGGLIAPNGRKSNLTSEQYKLVRTSEFKSWFGDWENDPENASKVVDENGEPMVVYHGAKRKFYNFKNKIKYSDKNPNYVSGFWFFADPIGQSLSKEDREYFYREGSARWMAENWVEDKEGNSISEVLECFLNVRNPIELDSYAEFLYWREDEDVIEKIKNKQRDGWFIHGSTTDGNIFRDDINVFESNQIKLADGSNTTFDASNPDIRYADGGNTSADFSKIMTASSRFRPSETIFFDPPLVGLNGNKLVSYTWAYDWTVDFDKYKGEEYSKRVSDWTQAEISADTGRDIVHKYTILNTDGTSVTVSSDSVPILLGYLDRKTSGSFPNLVTAAKTLAKQKLQLSILESKYQQFKDAREAIIKAGYPEVIIEKTDSPLGDRYKMGDGSVRVSDKFDYERMETLKGFYVDGELRKIGIEPSGYRLSNDIYELKNRISRQERKIQNILESKMEDGGKTDIGYADGGEVDENNETYKKWKSLVNMSKSELENFYNSQEGKDAGLSASEARSQGIDSGRESARWIMRMKDTPKANWTPEMWRWAKKQISFISRMSGNKGSLYDDKGRKTRKHTSLLIWGHNPKKYKSGGMTEKDINKFEIEAIKLSNKYKLPYEFIEQQLLDGIEIEHEHTDSEKEAMKIALDHLNENPNYYIKLKEMEIELEETPYDAYLDRIMPIYKNGGEIDQIYSFITPTGKPSKLNYIQQILVRTKQFKNWFGDWEVAAQKYIDGNFYNFREAYKNCSIVIHYDTLEPSVEYHGTNFKEEFYRFDVTKEQGVGRPYGYFADNKEYSENFTTSSQRGQDGLYLLYNCFLNIRNPLMAIGAEFVDKKGDAGYWIDMITKVLYYDKYKKSIEDATNKEQLDMLKIVTEQIGDYLRNVFVDDNPFWFAMAKDKNKEFKYFLLSHGFDGVRYTEEFKSVYDVNNPAEFTAAWTIFDASQVKLADGRNIEFNPMTEDIRYEEGGNTQGVMDDTDKVSAFRHKIGLSSYAEGGTVMGDGKKTDDAKKGGYFVGRSHDEGGIKGVNKDTGQMIEVEGNEVIINKRSVQNPEKRMFEGKMMTNREILSKINQEGGGVAFEEGGEITKKNCACTGKKYKFGGDLLSDYDIVEKIHADNEVAYHNQSYAEQLNMRLNKK